nr:hypothetical protein [Alkalicoccus halolimnae]
MGRLQDDKGRAPLRPTNGKTESAESGPPGASPWKRKRPFIVYLLYFQGSLFSQSFSTNAVHYKLVTIMEK